ncbi:apbe family lipoprotein [Melioribacter roseus P3M-2]|jgi:thiamine biosynthesis lipoprotein|uniref:FAD:protein FMN transferase n=1 Tax=Melioribacter roseus (strain DSM 23840 / JCM 17771 / VKM B-2668 / P3M-2) TaxID=1191523 RepID=I6ZRL8_MELRP|nr:FAD:protein FMN transferase [Melioribacter roseus]AFN74714.1 apbe family lipoprotein [Melioribacter roseus P3M-2]
MKKYLVILILLAAACSEDTTYKRVSIVMGSAIEIQVRGVNEVTANKAITASFEEARRLDTLFSTYIDGNPMWKINNTIADEILIDREIFHVMRRCDELWKLTGGAFDPAVANLGLLYGFDNDEDNYRIPSEGEIQNALSNSGWKHITLREPNILVKPAGVKINFNSCIPGYAADRIANLLSNYGVKEYLINVGGEIFARGKDWKVGIQHPRNPNDFLAVIKVDGFGVATSGDYEKYIDSNGKRITHIFNPVTGKPAGHYESVTVIAPDAMTADALSTALFVMEIDEALNLINSLENTEAVFVDSSGTIRKSLNFDKYIAGE